MLRNVLRAPAILLIALLALSSCRSDHVQLAYGLQPGRELAYELTLEANVRRTLSGDEREQQVRATFRTTQTITGEPSATGAAATITLSPETLEVDGRSVPPGSPQRFDVTLAPDGRVSSIRSSTGEAPDVLAPIGIDRLLPRLRPVLPGGTVAPGDRWSTQTDFTDPAGTFSLALGSRLASLGLTDGYRAALIRSAYTSPVSRTETFANAIADIDGEDVGNQEAWFALDGFLLRSAGDSVGQYRVSFLPPGGNAGVPPVTGSLVVRLHTELDLVASGQA